MYSPPSPAPGRPAHTSVHQLARGSSLELHQHQLGRLSVGGGSRLLRAPRPVVACCSCPSAAPRAHRSCASCSRPVGATHIYTTLMQGVCWYWGVVGLGGMRTAGYAIPARGRVPPPPAPLALLHTSSAPVCVHVAAAGRPSAPQQHARLAQPMGRARAGVQACTRAAVPRRGSAWAASAISARS